MEKNNYKFPAYKTGVPCHTLGFHIGVHDEELASAAYLYMYGKELHPGIKAAIDAENFIFVDAGLLLYEDKDWEQCHAEGIVFIGVMGSPYDEHTLPNDIRKKECSTTLVTRALNIHQEIEVRNVLKELLHSDRQSERSILSFSSHIMRAHKFHGTKNIEAMKGVAAWGIEPFLWLIKYQSDQIKTTKEELRTCSYVEKINYLGKWITVAHIESDNDQILGLAKTSAGIGAHLVILKNSKGQVIISPSIFPFIDLRLVKKEILLEEMRQRNMPYNPDDPRLESSDPFPSIPWHFQEEENLHRLFNGSLSAPNVEPTKIPLGRIWGIVTTTLKKARRSEEAVLRKMAS